MMLWRVLLLAIAMSSAGCHEEARAASEARRGTTPAAEPATSGQAVYRRHCAVCHKSDGQGMDGVPSLLDRLDRTDRALGDAVRRGSDAGIVAMPAHERHLSDAEISAVVTFIKSRFGRSSP